MDWFTQRHDDAIWAARVEEGRCGNCGAYDGPTHRCPSRTATKARRRVEENLDALTESVVFPDRA